MNFTLHQLKIFTKVAELQSVTRAADELHLTQPAVSIQLKNLQEQFDVPLIEVIGRKLFVTDFGKDVEEAGNEILQQVDELRYKALAYKGILSGQLKFSVVSTGKYVMPYFLADFSEKFNGVELIMDVTNKSRVVESLQKNEVDFALVSVLPENIRVERLELLQNKLYLVRKRKEKPNDKAFKVKDLQHTQLIYREPGSATRQAMENFMKAQSLPPQKSIELTSNEAVKQAVMAGLGYSVMPLIGIKRELQNEELEIVPIKGLPIVTHWNLVWLKDKRLSPTAVAYLEFIKSIREAFVKWQFDWYEKY